MHSEDLTRGVHDCPALVPSQMTMYTVDNLYTTSLAFKFFSYSEGHIPYANLTELMASEPEVGRTQRVLA